MSNDRRAEVEAFLARILGGKQMPESPLPKAPATPEAAKGDATNEEPKPELKYEYFIFYVLTTEEGPVLGNTVAGTNTPLSSKNFDAMRRSLIMEYMQDTGKKGIGEDALTIVSINRLS